MIRSIIAFPGGARVGVVVAGEGFFFRRDGQWDAEPDAALGKVIELVTVSRHNADTLFALVAQAATSQAPGQHPRELIGRLLVAFDRGQSWTKAEGLPESERITGVAESGDAGVVFAASLSRTVYRSDDNGRRFVRLGQVSLPAVAPASENRWATLVARRKAGATTLVLGSSFGAHLSDDEGKTWTPLPIGDFQNNYQCRELALTEDENSLLLATREGLFVGRLN